MSTAKISSLLFFIISLSISVYSQPAISWSDCYGGTMGEGGRSIINTTDGGYLIVGSTSSNDGDVSGAYCIYDSVNNVCLPYQDAWVIKIDAAGNLLWQKCLGGHDVDECVMVVESGNGYVLACNTLSTEGDVTFNHGGPDFWITKIDYNGNIIWEHCYGGSLSENVYGIAKTIDGGFVVCGTVDSYDGNVAGRHGVVGSDGWLLKLDSMGQLIWQKCLGGTHVELYQQIQSDTLGNIYFLTMTGSVDDDITCHVNGHSIWLSKLDLNGNILWDNCFGGTGGQIINSMRIYGDKLLMSGKSASNDGDFTHNYGHYDAWILLTDTSGNKIFSESYGGSQTDLFNDAILVNDKIIAGGSTLSVDHDVTMNHPVFNLSDCWLICVDTLGNLLWENTYGGSYDEECNSLSPVSGSGIILTGYTSTNNDGDISGYHGTHWGQVWVAEFDLINNVTSFRDEHFSIYPQPFTESIHIRSPVFSNKDFNITLFDIQGKSIPVSQIKTDKELILTSAKNLLSGMYILNIRTSNNVYSFKIIKI